MTRHHAPNLDLILGKRSPAEISAAYAQYIGALDAAIAVAESAAARPMVAQAKVVARSESVADRTLRDGSTFANIEHATTWTRESLKNLLAVVCIVAAKVLPESDVSVLLDEASDLMDEPAEPYDADQAKQDWLAERAAEDYYDKRDRA